VGEPLPENLTLLISQSRTGSEDARQRLFTLVYDELLQIARRSRYVGRAGDTMQPTALAHEAYLLFGKRFPVPPRDEPENRVTFFRTVAQAMRTILRDYWRKKRSAKRGGGAPRVSLGTPGAPEPGSDSGLDAVDFLALDEALSRLERYNQRWFDVVMHRYFAGQSIEETAAQMGCGITTVKDDWRLARGWLHRELGGQAGDRPH
jgi:RNA polymerase sigma factor (TIGR02999 family)